MNLIFSLVIFKLISECSVMHPPPTVRLPQGILEGHSKKTLTGKEFLAFEGVPYALPPIGKHRFKEAIPSKPWMGTWKAVTIHKCLQYEQFPPPSQDKVSDYFAMILEIGIKKALGESVEAIPSKPWMGTWKAVTIHKCLQYEQFPPPSQDKVSGDEDCLYLNIYTPNVNAMKKLDVLVFIHGGAFMFNYGASFGPEIILDRDIVYVNFNYRLGPLGFLSTEDNVVPGNNGLRDQILALKWIKANIEYFGGNSNSITISGLSSGAASVQLHYLIPEVRGLFHKGISQSGSALNPWVLLEKPLEKAKKLSDIVGCPIHDNKQMVKCLRYKPAKQLVGAIKHFQPYLYNPFSPFAVVVDTWANNSLLPEHPYKLLLDGKVADLPWLVSYVSEEGLYPGTDFYQDEHLEYIEKNWDEVLPYILHYNDVIPENLLNSVSQRIREEYFNEQQLTKGTFRSFIEAMSDRLFIDDMEKATRLQNVAMKSPVFVYYFDYRGAHSKTEKRIFSNENIGVSHGDDTAYMFYSNVNTSSTPADLEMSRIMVDTLISFMEVGKPNTTTDWKPLSKENSAPWIQLHITNPKNIYIEEMQGHLGNRPFWKSLGFEENEKLLNIHDEL